MLGLTREDFAIRARNFDLTKEWNVLRIIAGALMFPHVAGKFVSWMTLSQPTVQFFAKAGMAPGEVWVWIAACAEALSGACLLLGICTRYAALGAAAVLAIAAWAIVDVRGFGWVWNKGGIEYPVFWAIVCLMVAVREFKTLQAGSAARLPAVRALAALRS
jgi:putative oxidoreductase